MLARVLLLFSGAASVCTAAAVVEEIVCKVNGDVITQSDLQRRSLELGSDALRQQIDELLLLQRAKELNFSAASEVTRQIAAIQADNNIADADKFRDFIREQTGMTVEDFRQRLANQALISRVVGEEVERAVVVSDAEKKEYYDGHKSEFMRRDEVWLRQIFVAGTTAEAERKAREVAVRARAGERFGALARRYSDDVETARVDGQMPAFTRGELRREIEEAVFAQKRGYVTDPLRVPEGFLILRIEERHTAGLASYDDVAGVISQKLAEPRVAEKLREFLTKLRQNAFLQIRDGYVDSGAAPGKDTAWRDTPLAAPPTVSKEELAAQRKRKALSR
jgi:peptidyl-prolyl cis-trans isomerase SurA